MKKKGFTLIELLAVIVILAIVALTATPLVLNVIDDAKKGAFKTTIHNIVDVMEKTVITNALKGNDADIIKVTCDGVSCKSGNDEIPIKGDIQARGTINMYKDGTSHMFLTNDEQCAIKNTNSEDMTVDNCDNFVLIYKIDDLDFDNENDYNLPLAIGDFNGDGVENDIKTEFTDENGQGLFTNISGATIRNLIVKNANISAAVI